MPGPETVETRADCAGLRGFPPRQGALEWRQASIQAFFSIWLLLIGWMLIVTVPSPSFLSEAQGTRHMGQGCEQTVGRGQRTSRSGTLSQGVSDKNDLKQLGGGIPGPELSNRTHFETETFCGRVATHHLECGKVQQGNRILNFI